MLREAQLNKYITLLRAALIFTIQGRQSLCTDGDWTRTSIRIKFTSFLNQCRSWLGVDPTVYSGQNWWYILLWECCSVHQRHSTWSSHFGQGLATIWHRWLLKCCTPYNTFNDHQNFPEKHAHGPPSRFDWPDHLPSLCYATVILC